MFPLLSELRQKLHLNFDPTSLKVGSTSFEVRSYLFEVWPNFI